MFEAICWLIFIAVVAFRFASFSKDRKEKQQAAKSIIDMAGQHYLKSALTSAEEGNVEAQTVIAFIYLNGQGVPKDESKAVYWFKRAAEQGDPEAQHLFGNLLGTGIIVPDYEEAAYWNKKAAEQGHHGAQFALGAASWLGRGVEQDYIQAEYWLKKAANGGNLEAQQLLKSLSETNLNTSLTPNEEGTAEAQIVQGYMYLKGQGVPKDESKAVYFFKQAAEQGHPDGQHLFGSMLCTGTGIPLDYKKSVYWLTKAAEQDHAGAQALLGISYWSGLGVEQSYTKADYWLQKAAKKGNPEAKKFLKDSQKLLKSLS